MMSWRLFIVALLVTYVVQTAILKHFAPEWLNLLLVLALVVGLSAPAIDARLAAWIVGFAVDAGTDGPLGLNALALGLAVLGLTYLREMVNRELWWVRWLAAFLVAMPAQLFVRLYEHYADDTALGWLQLIGQALATSLVAALLAALILHLPALLGRRRRYSAARW
ncbi:MAG: rod shape-determining protein MreD [Phycisphaerae bacterium]|jgi:rod shape-determining protein MreD|nr:rod shape-determining protein MreD [Phycisphaerae bacterium]